MLEPEQSNRDESQKMNEVNYASSGIVGFVAKVGGLACSFASIWILNRLLDVSDFGAYCLALTVLNVFVVIARFGLPELLLYRASKYLSGGERNRADNLAGGILYSTLILSLLFSVILVLLSGRIGVLMKSELLAKWLVITAIVLPLNIIIEVYYRWYQATRNVNVAVLNRIFFRPAIFTVLLGVLYYFDSVASFHKVCLALIASYGLVALYFAKDIRVWKHFKLGYVKKEPISYALFSAANLFIVIFILNIDTLMLGYFCADDEVAVYQIALRFSILAMIVLDSLEPAFTSKLSHYMAQKSYPLVKSESSKIESLSFAYWIVLAVGFILFGKDILLFFGPYEASYPIVLILFFSRAFAVNFSLLSNVLSLGGKANLVFMNTCLIIVFNVIGGLLLIPRFGVTGAAFATLIAFGGQAVLRTWQVYRYFNINKFGSLLYVLPLGVLVLTAAYVGSDVVITSILFVMLLFLIYFVRRVGVVGLIKNQAVLLRRRLA